MHNGRRSGKVRFAKDSISIGAAEIHPVIFPRVVIVRKIFYLGKGTDKENIACGKGKTALGSDVIALSRNDKMKYELLSYTLAPPLGGFAFLMSRVCDRQRNALPGNGSHGMLECP